MGRYYVYALYREDGTPFYVGKGCDKRMENHEKNAHRNHQGPHYDHIRDMRERGAPIRKRVLYSGIATPHEAFRMEKAVITAIGRRPHGPLLNDHPGNWAGNVPEARSFVIRRQHHWRLRPLTRVRVSARAANAFAAVKAVFPHFAEWGPNGHWLWVDERALNWFNALRDEGEAYSRAILRLVDMMTKKEI